MHLDLFSHHRQDKLEEKANIEYFLGFDGKIHSFINYNRDFSLWLNTAILDNFNLEKLKLSTSNNITFWKDGKGWISKPSDKILEKNFALIKNGLSKIQNTEQDFFISVGRLNQGIFEGEEFEIYFNN